MKTTVLVRSTWAPAVGDAAPYAERLANNPQLQQELIILPHQVLKRLSVFFSEDPSDMAIWIVCLRTFASALSNLRNYWKLLRRFHPTIVQCHYTGPFRVH